jgi:hypothetical protein
MLSTQQLGATGARLADEPLVTIERSTGRVRFSTVTIRTAASRNSVV